MSMLRSRSARTSSGQKLLALVLVGVVIYYLWLQGGIGYPGGVPGAPTILSPIPMQPFNVASDITVSWRIPSGVVQKAYRIVIGNQDFSNIQRDTGKTTGNTTSITITAPTVTGTHYVKLCYWDDKDVQSNPSTVQITVTLVTTPMFSVIPDKSMTSSWTGSFSLELVNNADFEISQVKIMLIDQYGVFQQFKVYTLYGGPYSCLNTYHFFHLQFNSGDPNVLPMDQTKSFSCWASVSASAPAGTHTLAWRISFLASSSEAPPSIEIPWKVTIYG